MPKKAPPKPIVLNDEQRVVVSAREGYYCVQAGPGSGKSTVLVARITELLNEGVPPESIRSFSFTATAAKNLRDRVEAQIGKSINRTATTFHSLALTFAQEERSAYPFELAEFPLATEPVANKMSADAARKYEVDPRVLRQWISLRKRHRIGWQESVRIAEQGKNGAEIKRAMGYKDYESKLRENGVLDFDSLLFWMVEILEKAPVTLSSRWQPLYVQVDEAQDCSSLEWRLLQLLTLKHGNLMAVGDQSQSCYAFRGSEPNLFADMGSMFPGCEVLYLARNYRSTKKIVQFIKPYAASEELAQKFHTSNEEGSEPVVQGFGNSWDEAKWVVDKIRGSV